VCVCVCAEPVKARNLQLERQDVVGPKTIFFMPCRYVYFGITQTIIIRHYNAYRIISRDNGAWSQLKKYTEMFPLFQKNDFIIKV